MRVARLAHEERQADVGVADLAHALGVMAEVDGRMGEIVRVAKQFAEGQVAGAAEQRDELAVSAHLNRSQRATLERRGERLRPTLIAFGKDMRPERLAQPVQQRLAQLARRLTRPRRRR